MFLMYVDESGDPGLVNSPTRYYVLSGLVLHELRWRPVLQKLLAFRCGLRDRYGLKLREELHAGAMINKPGALVRIKRHDRLAILRDFADALASIPELNVINVVVDKEGKPPGYGVFECAWRVLIQRFEDTIAHRNFRGPCNLEERAMVFPDNTDSKRLQRLIRELRVRNPIPSRAGGGYRNAPMVHIIEDPVIRNSEESYLIQAVDLCAYLLYQELAPGAYMKKKAGHNYFARLAPVLCTVASTKDPRGIVRL
jgi:hypothetical protein